MTDRTQDSPAGGPFLPERASPIADPGTALRLLAAGSRAEGDWPDLYAPLIGSWAIESRFTGSDGTSQHALGEWHFERILGGMGVQDVLFAVGTKPRQYGTSLRVVDPRTGLWHVVWMQPGSGEFVSLVGRQEGDRIIHEGPPLDDPDAPLQRWSFCDIDEASFTWTGESSTDGGASWALEQKMHGTRVGSGEIPDG